MSARMSQKDPREEAERWFARLMAPDCSRLEREEFQRWREASAAHAQAYVATEDLLGRVDALAASDARLQSLMSRARVGNAEERGWGAARWLRWARPVAIAASVVVVAVTGYLGAGHWFRPATPLTVYSTQAETQIITLSDGTVVQLDVHSTMSASITNRARQIEVRTGRVLFTVRHDPTRPVTVRAGAGTIMDLGTRFQVDRRGERVTVALAEGAVRVTNQSDGSAGLNAVDLHPGQELTYSSDSPLWATREVDVQMLMSWSRGRLVFRGTPLAQLIDEVNRYTERKIQLADSTLGELPVQGNFVTGDSEAVVAALEAVLPVEVQRDGATLVLVRRK